ncbi:MAG TPA: DUF423 domain-containing protein [Rhodanobacteraceae bacterium]|nr:DUF423 domain-containing protein [Rhodanobacteraceae bacterium]
MKAPGVPRATGIVLAILGASAVGLGAFGAHALRGSLPPLQMDIWHTAVEYHFWHTLAFGLAATIIPRARTARWAAWLFAFGVLLFCGSLYALALGALPCEQCGQDVHFLILAFRTNAKIIGAITPFGGICFILGWIALGIALVRRGIFGAD